MMGKPRNRGVVWTDDVSLQLGMMVIHARVGTLYRAWPHMQILVLQLLTLNELVRMLPDED